MSLFIGLLICVPLLLNDALMFFLIKHIDAKRSFSVLGINFLLGMFLSILYTISIILAVKDMNVLLFAIGIGVGLMIEIVTKIVYSILSNEKEKKRK